jgi:hypothetical protein
MTSEKIALIIGTEVATNGFESGAALRLDSIKNLVESSGFKVSVTSRARAKDFLKSDWDLVVLVSFSTGSLLRLARERTKLLWFDPTDSWVLTRLSLIRSGDLKQVLILGRDLYFIWTSPKIDLITFITKRDAIKEQRWWRKRSVPIILPIEGLDRQIAPEKKARLVFFGDGLYRPNRKALQFLVRTLEFLPSDVQIHLIGRDLRSHNERFVIHGYVANHETYFVNDVHLAPVQHGGGLKLKVALPLWNGLRVISTPEGSSGFRNSSKLKIASTPLEFADRITEALGEDNLDIRVKPANKIYLVNEIEVVNRWLKERM